IDVLNISDLSNITLLKSLDLAAYGARANSVAFHNGYIACAVEAHNKQDNGKIVIFKTSDQSFVAALEVGALPDMITFSPDGTKILSANEGEPNDDWSNDPEGSVSIVDLS